METQGSRLKTLTREGWTRKFVACEPRLSEAVAMYKASGHEVHLEPVSPRENASDLSMMDSDCVSCFEGAEDQYKIIFTRPEQESPASNDDLL